MHALGPSPLAEGGENAAKARKHSHAPEAAPASAAAAEHSPKPKRKQAGQTSSAEVGWED